MTYTEHHLIGVANPAHEFNYLHTFISGKIDVCTNPRSHNYHNYGGRGIKVLDEWVTRPKSCMLWILNNLGPRPELGMTIDRICNDGHCEPGNLRWATHSQQQLNKRPWTNTGEHCISFVTGRQTYKVILPGKKFIGTCKSLTDAIKLRDSKL